MSSEALELPTVRQIFNAVAYKKNKIDPLMVDFTLVRSAE